MNKLLHAIMHNTNYAYDLLKTLKENPDWIEENCDGLVDPGLMLDFAERCHSVDSLCNLLPYLVDAIDSACITDDVFSALLQFPKQYADLVVALSHKSLSESQLLVLCKAEIAFECFFELAALYYCNSLYSLERLISFVNSFREGKFAEMYGDLLNELNERYTASDPQKNTWLLEKLL